MAKKADFFAYSRDGEKCKIARPPVKLSNHVLRKEEWNNAAAMCKKVKGVEKKRSLKTKKKSTKSIRNTLDAISYNDPEFECLHCSRLGDDSLCTVKCYHSFTKLHLTPITANIQIRGPGPLGYSAHTTTPLAKHQWLGEYIGELRPLSLSRTQQSHYWLEIPGKCAIDAEEKGNWTRFMNSSCEPNVKLWGECLGKRHVVLFQALRDIEAGEELCFQYGRAYFEKAGFECRCPIHEGGKHLPEAGRKRRHRR
ncbi:hypothetical protein N0V90_010562 [Kalmusia sp. IMI 367209]|nr:hypothetical protein N0V90_010562 [Kalmusia sp. IMI 367209]